MNQQGNLTSSWSNAVLNQPKSQPSSPTDLKILDSYSTGFSLQFRDPTDFRGYLSHYLLRIQPFALLEADQTLNLVSPAEKKCKPNQATPNQTTLSITGLPSFKSYRVSITAVNNLGFESDSSELIVANTIETGPRGLRPLSVFVESSKRVVFKFTDPNYPNGLIKNFNLYEVRTDLGRPICNKRVYYDYELHMLYSGSSREFVLKNLTAYTKYSFLYEVCSVYCTRQLKLTEVITPESEPEYQIMPIVTRLLPFLNCFRLNWTLPLKPNGQITHFNVFRSIRSLNRFEPCTETLVARLEANIAGNKSFDKIFGFLFCYMLRIQIFF